MGDTESLLGVGWAEVWARCDGECLGPAYSLRHHRWVQRIVAGSAGDAGEGRLYDPGRPDHSLSSGCGRQPVHLQPVRVSFGTVWRDAERVLSIRTGLLQEDGVQIEPALCGLLDP